MLQAVWTRFFPASVEIRRLLAQGEVGEVKMVRSEFGAPLMHVQRAVQKELGGGAILDIGIYCLQFISMVYNGEKPECIQATGVCMETGNEKEGLTERPKQRYHFIELPICKHMARCCTCTIMLC